MDKKDKKGKLSVSPTVKQRVKEVLHRARQQSAEEKKAREKKTEVKLEKMPPVVADCRGLSFEEMVQLCCELSRISNQERAIREYGLLVKGTGTQTLDVHMILEGGEVVLEDLWPPPSQDLIHMLCCMLSMNFLLNRPKLIRLSIKGLVTAESETRNSALIFSCLGIQTNGLPKFLDKRIPTGSSTRTAIKKLAVPRKLDKSTLTEIDFSRNRFTAETADFFELAMKQNRSLTTLRLSSSEIGSVSDALVDYIEAKRVGTGDSYREMPLTKARESMMSLPRALRLLDLSYCGISTSMATHISSILASKRLPELRYLDISYNTVDPVTFVSLFECGARHPRLEFLSLRGSTQFSRVEVSLSQDPERLLDHRALTGFHERETYEGVENAELEAMEGRISAMKDEGLLSEAQEKELVALRERRAEIDEEIVTTHSLSKRRKLLVEEDKMLRAKIALLNGNSWEMDKLKEYYSRLRTSISAPSALLKTDISEVDLPKDLLDGIGRERKRVRGGVSFLVENDKGEQIRREVVIISTAGD